MTDSPDYRGYRFPPEVIARAVWLYHRFTLSFRDVEDLMAERGITASYETVRQWCLTFGPVYARKIRKRQGPRGDRWFLDEVVVSIQGKRRYLWRAVDQDGDLIEILVQSRKDTKAAKHFFRKALRSQSQVPIEITTDKLRSTRPPNATCSRQSCIAKCNTRTIERRCRMNRPGSKKGKCVGFDRMLRRNVF